MSKSSRSPSRRRLFVGAGAVGAAAVAAAALPLVRPTAAAPEASPSTAGDKDGRYQLTAHVQRYYESAKV